MKSKTLVFTSAILFFVCICVLFFFRLSPSFKIWDGYNVVYVDKTLSADEVNRTLSQAGITGIVSPLHNPFPPLPVMAPVQHTALYDNFSYNDLQTLFFSDKNDLFNLYYIPQRYKTKAAAALQRIHVLWGIDAPYSMPWIIPIALCVVCAYFTFFAKNRLFFLCAVFPLVCYAAAVPLYQTASFVCMCLYALFGIQKLWQRRYFFEAIKYRFVLLIPFVFLPVSAVLLGLRSFLLLCTSCTACSALIYILLKTEKLQRNKKSFNPVPIFSARTVQTSDIFNLRFALLPAICAAVFCLCAASGIHTPAHASAKNTKAGLYLPAPAVHTVQKDFSAASYKAVLKYEVKNRLPDLTDFIHASWYTQTYPFRRLEKADAGFKLPEFGERVNFSDYIKSGEKLEKKMLSAQVFDEKFIQKTVDAARNANAADSVNTANGTNGAAADKAFGIQRLLAAQRGFMRTLYIRADSAKGGKLSLVFTFAAFAYILSIIIGFAIKRRI
ncbi:MAG: hypothetical protein ACFNX1_02245 [Treponema lecithinolyticum]|uniref:hypothetical protein n=1 Tax=Treponema lecithinolyticum TaxID=53418 RepID=UPI0036171F11